MIFGDTKPEQTRKTNFDEQDRVSPQLHQSPVHSILNFDDEDIDDEVQEQSQVQKVKHVDLQSVSRKSNRHDSLSRAEFINQQRTKFTEKQKQPESPLRINKNSSFYKEEEVDFSQFGNEEPQKEQFEYQINGSKVSLSRLEIDEDEDEQPQKKEYQILFRAREMFGLSRVLDDEGLKDMSLFKQVNQHSNTQQQSPQRHENKPKSVQFIDQNGTSPVKLEQQKQIQKKNETPKEPEQLKYKKPVILKEIQILDIKNWLHTPVPQGCLLQCYIVRDTSGLATFYPKFHLHLSDGQYLMTAKRLAMQKTAKYILTTDKNELSRKSPKYLGIIRSNFLGTEFMLYDPGLNPKATEDFSLLRKQLALFNFESNVMQTRSNNFQFTFSSQKIKSYSSRNY